MVQDNQVENKRKFIQSHRQKMHLEAGQLIKLRLQTTGLNMNTTKRMEWLIKTYFKES